MNRIKLVISDFHLSRGKWLKDGRRNPLEDFHQDELFAEFLDHYSQREYQDADVELIINGDFFDPLAVIPIPSETGQKLPPLDYPLEVEESAAVDKFRTICEAHPVSIDGLKRFLSRGKKILIRWGNHDAGLLWPDVQNYLIHLLAPPSPGLLRFGQEPYVFDRVCVDHGHQLEWLNHFDTNQMFIERRARDGKIRKIQNLPFGSFFVLGFLNVLKLKSPHITWVQPFRQYLRWNFYMNPIYFWANGFRVVWFFIKMRFITHPMRFARFKKTLLLITETIHRPSLETIAEKTLTEPGSENLGYDTLILGHNHQAQVRVFGNGKTYINTGTWTPITSLDLASLGHRVLRTYGLITYDEAGRAKASLKVWQGTPREIVDFTQL